MDYRNYYRWERDALFLDCSIQPGASQDSLIGPVGERLKIRIAAPPTDGKANKQLIRFLARVFGTRQNAITVVNGRTSRHKRLRIEKPFPLPKGLEIAADEFAEN